jgi:ABC-2 type transport system ATP-binding protein
LSALAIESLGHGFGKRPVLKDVDLRVEPGSFTVLLGPNGAGKTTLVSLVTGLYTARTGTIRVLGHDIRREPLRALAQLGIVFQAATLDLDLTVTENLIYHAALRGLPRREVRARVEAELGRLDLGSRAADKVRTLSGGLRRRVEIARAFLHHPRLLIVDEATVGLDVASRLSVIRSVRTRCRDEGLSVLWATHLLDEIADDDPLVVIHEGAVRWRGLARELSQEQAGLSEAFLRLTGERG